MKVDVMRRVEADRLGEEQSLRDAATAAAATRQHDSDVLIAHTKQLEATRHRELRARIEQHRVNQVLQSRLLTAILFACVTCWQYQIIIHHIYM